jgi:hypothetical protein
MAPPVVPGDVPQGVAAIIKDCLVYEPLRRPYAAAVLQRIERLLAVEPHALA